MKKAHIQGLETLAADYLQYRYGIYLHTKKVLGNDSDERPSPDFIFYDGACKMLEAMGCEWRRHYCGDSTQESLDDIKNYSHSVWFPEKERLDRMNFDAWK